MDDLIKFAGLTRFLCETCVKTRDYHLQGHSTESWWCPHHKRLVVWSDAAGPSGIVFNDVDDKEYFSMLQELRELAQMLALQAQAKTN